MCKYRRQREGATDIAIDDREIESKRKDGKSRKLSMLTNAIYSAYLKKAFGEYSRECIATLASCHLPHTYRIIFASIYFRSLVLVCIRFECNLNGI